MKANRARILDQPVYINLNIQYVQVFIKYCVLFQEFSKVCHLSLASSGLLLVVEVTIALR